MRGLEFRGSGLEGRLVPMEYSDVPTFWHGLWYFPKNDAVVIAAAGKYSRDCMESRRKPGMLYGQDSCVLPGGGRISVFLIVV